MNEIVQSLKPQNTQQIESYLLNEMGITSEVVIINERPAIKVFHHFSLLNVIIKIQRDFDFEVYHKKGKNEYIIYLN